MSSSNWSVWITILVFVGGLTLGLVLQRAYDDREPEPSPAVVELDSLIMELEDLNTRGELLIDAIREYCLALSEAQGIDPHLCHMRQYPMPDSSLQIANRREHGLQ